MAHNAMATEYDVLDDLWYPHLFNRLHAGILHGLPPKAGVALDAGCGTGFQSMLLAMAGYAVTGVDLADELLKQAREKASDPIFAQGEPVPLFSTNDGTAQREMDAISRQAAAMRREPVIPPVFRVGDIGDPSLYPLESQDAVVCCGSVLSFVDDPEKVVALMASTLKKGGLLFLEVEQRLNADILWPFVDILIGGRLGYGQDFKTAWRNLVTPPGCDLHLDFPFEMKNGSKLSLPMRLFSLPALETMLAINGLQMREKMGVHVLTNLLPSTILHRPGAGRFLRVVFGFLAWLEKFCAHKRFFSAFGCSCFYVLEKT